MKKSNIILFFAVCVFCILLTGQVFAKSPIAVYYEDEKKIEVTGELDGELNTDTVNIFVLKSSANYLSFSAEDILHMASQTVNENKEYSFKFSMEHDYNNCRIYIKAANKYIPVTAFKTVINENVRDFTGAYVEAEKNVLVCGTEMILNAKAMSGDLELDYDSCEFIIDNSDVATVEGNVLKGLKKGAVNVYAKISINGKIISSEAEKIEIREDKAYPSLIGVTFKKQAEILDITGDISNADNIIFSFDAPIKNISGISVINLIDSSERFFEGIYNNENLSYEVDLNGELGFGKFKFQIISEDMLGLSSLIEGSDVSFGVENVVVTGNEYLLELSFFNYRDYDIPVNNVKFSGDCVSDNVFSPQADGEYVIGAEFYSDGEKRSVLKKIKAVGVEKIVPQIDNLRMEVLSTQIMDITVIGTDGSVLNASPVFTSSNQTKLTVSSSGVIYAKERGTAKITVECGGKSAQVTVFVGVDGNNDVLCGTLIESSGIIEVGEKSKISLKNYMLSGATGEITDAKFSSDNNEVVTVDDNGIITGIGIGEATITAEYNGEIYRKIIKVLERKIISAKLELDSCSIPKNSYEKVKLLVNSNEYLSGKEFKLYSENSEVLEIKDNFIYASKEGISGIYAIVEINGDKIKTETIEINVFNPTGGYLIDEFENSNNLFYMDSRLSVRDGKIYTKGSTDSNAELIYHLNGDINDFMIYDYICNPTYQYEDVYIYVSADNEEYIRVTDFVRIKGSQVNGWGTDVLKAENIESGMRYLKIVLDNRDLSTQGTQISRVEIGYSTNPEVIDVQITDDCQDDEIYKNVFGRKAVITFNQPINLDTLNNITVEGNKLSDVEYFADLLRCEFVIPDKDMDNYNIKIEGVTEYTGKENVMFNAVAEKVENVYEISGSIIYELDENVNAERILIKNDTLYPKEYTIIECDYDETGRLTGVKKKASGRVDAVSEKYIYLERKLSQLNKTFVWESFDSMVPLEK